MDNKPDNELQTKELQTKNNSKNQIIIAVVLTTLVFGTIGAFQLFSMFRSKIRVRQLIFQIAMRIQVFQNSLIRIRSNRLQVEFRKA